MFFHLLNALLAGVTKLEAIQWYKVTKLNPSKPSPLLFLITWDAKIPAVASAL